MTPRILVTRPEPGASATARRLAETGYDAVTLPLTRIEALACAIDASSVGVVAATSANAIRHAPVALIAALSDKPAFAVGDETAAAMRAAGFKRVRSAGGDAAALTALVQRETPDGATIGYLCGKARKPAFEQAMRQAGRAVTIIETYDTVVVRPSRAEIDGVLGNDAIDAALVYSAEGAKTLLGTLGADRRLARAVLLCLSQAIADIAIADGRAALAADRPDEDALFELLAGAFPPAP